MPIPRPEPSAVGSLPDWRAPSPTRAALARARAQALVGEAKGGGSRHAFPVDGPQSLSVAGLSRIPDGKRDPPPCPAPTRGGEDANVSRRVDQTQKALVAAYAASSQAAAVLRALNVRDAAAAAELIPTAFAVQSRATILPSSALRETAESIAGKIAAGGGFGVFAHERLVAVALWGPDGDALMIARVSALPEARGRGLSKRLIDSCEAAARARGFSRLRLRVRLALPENERLFSRMGFSRARVEAHAGFDAPTVAVMEKPLP